MKKTSIIIPTFNGKHKIINALASLEMQTLLPDELIIVVDGSTDGTAEMLRNMKLSLPNYKIIEQENLGRAAVRNRGAIESTGELLIFLDDDMTVPKHWLEAHCEHHEKYPNSLMSGRLESPPVLSTNDFHSYRTWLGDKWNRDIEKSVSDQRQINFAYFNACNCSIEKTLFMKIGGFDKRLRDLEDYDMALRASQMSLNIYVAEDAYAISTDAGIASCFDYVKRLRSYHFAKQKLIDLKPEIYLEDIIKVDNFPNKFKKAIYWLLANFIWLKGIDKGWWTWLPRQFRYKMYDAILHSNSVLFPDKVLIE